MSTPIREEPISELAEIASIPIAFTVASKWSMVDSEIQEHPVAAPFIKDYDAIPGNSPLDWTRRLDTANWGLLTVWQHGRRIAAAAIAIRSRDLELLEQRDDLALLWDLRVAPQHRRRGIGTRLFEAAERWAQEHGCRELRIETQDINVVACRFYHRQGCELKGLNAAAYPALPGEIQVLWRKPLGSHEPAA